INYVRIWHDESRERSGDPAFLCLWRPVPPAGYMPLGLLVGLGGRPPQPGVPVRCVRADLAAPEPLPRSLPDWQLPASRQRALGLRGWQADPGRSGVFAVLVGGPQ
ncbi:hypothetical protein Agub_g14846, partial [Astrephomene gubernaculifera]